MHHHRWCGCIPSFCRLYVSTPFTLIDTTLTPHLLFLSSIGAVHRSRFPLWDLTKLHGGKPMLYTASHQHRCAIVLYFIGPPASSQTPHWLISPVMARPTQRCRNSSTDTTFVCCTKLSMRLTLSSSCLICVTQLGAIVHDL